ncbi:MAG: sugar phosphate isomerase/epimerase [Clostridia bacterium]|nr:sugar phosphate isomerase/epimerase [Clostridia bacterium]
MIRTFDMSMLNVPHPTEVIAPLAARYGMQAISVPGVVFEDEKKAGELDALVKGLGLSWGLLPLPADFYQYDLSDEDFASALKELERRAVIGERLGITHAYNHVWPTSHRPFDENFEWHVKRVSAVAGILADHGIRYGLEFLGPYELRSWQKYEFVHSLPGVLAIADAAGGKAGIAFDTFHWYCSTGGAPDDLLFMAQHTERLVAVHLNDAVKGVPVPEQRDMQRRLPLEDGVIDTRDILARFKAAPNDALYMIEPFEPGRTRFHGMEPEAAVRLAAEIFAKLEQ